MSLIVFLWGCLSLGSSVGVRSAIGIGRSTRTSVEEELHSVPIGGRLSPLISYFDERIESAMASRC